MPFSWALFWVQFSSFICAPPGMPTERITMIFSLFDSLLPQALRGQVGESGKVTLLSILLTLHIFGLCLSVSLSGLCHPQHSCFISRWSSYRVPTQLIPPEDDKLCQQQLDQAAWGFFLSQFLHSPLATVTGQQRSRMTIGSNHTHSQQEVARTNLTFRVLANVLANVR